MTGAEVVRSWRVVGAVAAAIALAVGVVVALAASNGRAGATGVASKTAFDLPRLDGPGRVQLAALRGKPVVVNLFASWCPPCREELPGFARVAHELQGQVTFIGVDSEDTGDGAGMARQYGLAASGILLAHDVGRSPVSGLHDSLGAPGMPATAFYDRQGRLVWRAIAALPETTLRAKLRELYGVKV